MSARLNQLHSANTRLTRKQISEHINPSEAIQRLRNWVTPLGGPLRRGMEEGLLATSQQGQNVDVYQYQAIPQSDPER